MTSSQQNPEAANFESILSTRRSIRDALAAVGIDSAVKEEAKRILDHGVRIAAAELGVDMHAIEVAEAALAEYEAKP